MGTVLKSGSVWSVSGCSFGSNGVIIALLITLVLSLLFISVNLNASIILAGAEWKFSLPRAINIPLLAGGGMLPLLGIALYVLNRND